MGEKLRVTCPSWDDAIVILPGECLALVNIERQVHVLRAKAPCRRSTPSAGTPRFWVRCRSLGAGQGEPRKAKTPPPQRSA
jgi:hypothetical protein